MMTKYRRLVTAVSSILVVFVIVAVVPVHATPDVDELIRTYPATMCQVWGPDVVSGTDKSAGYSQFGRIANKNKAKSLNIVCPIIRKENDGRNGLEYVVVTYLNRNPLIDLTCTVYSVDVNGETTLDSETQYSSVASELFERFIFRDIGVSTRHNGMSLQTGSMYTLFCTIPPKVGNNGFSWIGSYTVRENPEPNP